MLTNAWRACVLSAISVLAACAAPGPASLSPESRLRLAEAASQRGSRGQVSLPVARQAAALRPSDASALSQWAQAAEQAGDLTEAVTAQRSLLTLEGRNEPRLNSIGRLLLRAGDAQGAAQAYGEALALQPRSVAAASGLGLAQDMAGDRAAAQQSYRRGLAIAPSDWALKSNLGMSLIASGAPRDAAFVLVDAEILASAPTTARHNLALAYAADGQLDRAVRVLRSEMGQAGALAMAQEMAAFSRWLLPQGHAGQGASSSAAVAALQPIAESRRQARLPAD